MARTKKPHWNATHGDSDSPEYVSWTLMKRRCFNKSDNRYKSHGARGITVCDRWLGESGYDNFLRDMGRKPSSAHSLDRIDNDGMYSPSNCRWATPREQSRNTRRSVLLTVGGVTKPLVQWAEETGIGRSTISCRLSLGWPVEEALTVPVNRGVKRRHRLTSKDAA